MVRTAEILNDSLDALAEREKAFATVLEPTAAPSRASASRASTTLLRTIVGQQVSVAAARSMWNKLTAKFGQPVDLKALLDASDEELREAGLSRQKAGYARSLAGLVLSGELDLAHLPEDDEEAIALADQDQGHRPLVGGNLSAVRGRARRRLAGRRPRRADRDRQAAGPRGQADREAAARDWPRSWRPHRGAAAVLAWHSYNAPPLDSRG